MVAGEKKSLALSSLRGKSGTFMIPAYSTGGLPPTAWVISAVIPWLGRVLRSVQESPPSSETKMGAVALVDPPGLGVNAEAAMSFGFDPYSARNGSASCQLSPLSDAGIRSTTRTPVSLAGGCFTTGCSQAANSATATAINPARMTWKLLLDARICSVRRVWFTRISAIPSATLLRQGLVLVQPPQQLLDQARARNEVAALLHHMALLIGWSAEQPEHRDLRRLEWEEEVIAAVDHQRGDPDPRKEIDRLHLRAGPLEIKAGYVQRADLDPRLHRRDQPAHRTPPAQAVVGQVSRGDLRTGLQVDHRWIRLHPTLGKIEIHEQAVARVGSVHAHQLTRPVSLIHALDHLRGERGPVVLVHLPVGGEDGVRHRPHLEEIAPGAL